jgi:16S rRNA processing protein RimM
MRRNTAYEAFNQPWVEIGRVVKLQGLKGFVKCVSYLQAADLLPSIEQVMIQRDNGTDQVYRLKIMKSAGKGFLAGFEGIEDRSSAEKIVGAKIFMNAGKLPQLPEGEYYWKDLIGMAVIDENGPVLGRISGVFPTGSNDVLICEGADREILLPVIADVIRRVDIDNRTVIVQLPEGL